MQYILIKLPNWLGDVVMFTPTIALLQQFFKDAKIVLVGNALSTSVFCESNLIAKIFLDTSKEKKGIFARLQSISALAKDINLFLQENNKTQFDYAITAQNNFFSALLLAKIKAKQRIGYGDKNIFGIRKFLLTDTIPFKSGRTPFCTHQVLSYGNLLSTIIPSEFLQNASIDSKHANYNPHVTKNQNIIFTNTPELKLYLPITTRKLQQERIIALSAGASYGISKMWLPNYFSELIISFVQSGFSIKMYGAKNEREYNEEICKNAKALLPHNLHDKIENLSGKTSIAQLTNSLNECILYIGNDSGTTHIAKALKIPCIVLFGSMPFAWCSPWSTHAIQKEGEHYYIDDNVIALQKNLPCQPCKKRVCPLNHHNCMRLITPDEILSLAYALLANKK